MNDYEKRLFEKLCRILTEWEESRRFDTAEWYDVLVQVQNCVYAQEWRNKK